YIRGTVVQTWNLAGYETLEERFGSGSPAVLIEMTAITPDAVGRTVAITQTGAATVSYGYQYDLGGQLLFATDHGVAKSYNYHGQGELTNDDGVPHGYDPNGNRTDAGYEFSANNQLATDGTWNYTYDAEGNETTKTNIADGTKWIYGYDNKNHLVSTVKQD